MAGPPRKKTLRETDDQARALARRLVRQARYASIAVLDPESGAPLASRVLTGTASDGAPLILISALAPHMAALGADPRASLLFGEVGKGDPLAHARITVRVEAREVARAGTERERLRRRFIARHPKAKLYVDFPDFAFFVMQPLSASLNGGFGRAYLIEAADLLIASPASGEIAGLEAGAVDHMNSDHAEAADLYARAYGRSKKSGWSMISLDAAGFELINGDEIMRIDFDRVLTAKDEVRETLAAMLHRAREILG